VQTKEKEMNAIEEFVKHQADPEFQRMKAQVEKSAYEFNKAFKELKEKFPLSDRDYTYIMYGNMEQILGIGPLVYA
jgi:hypothetical protein